MDCISNNRTNELKILRRLKLSVLKHGSYLHRREILKGNNTSSSIHLTNSHIREHQGSFQNNALN